MPWYFSALSLSVCPTLSICTLSPLFSCISQFTDPLTTHKTSPSGLYSHTVILHAAGKVERGPVRPVSWLLVWELQGDGHGPVVACGVDGGRLGKQGDHRQWSLQVVR